MISSSVFDVPITNSYGTLSSCVVSSSSSRPWSWPMCRHPGEPLLTAGSPLPRSASQNGHSRKGAPRPVTHTHRSTDRGAWGEKPEVTQLSNGDLAVHPATSPANRLSEISQVPGTPCEGSASSSLCLFSWQQFADCFLGDLAVQLEKVKIIEAPKVLLPQARGRSSGLRSHPGRADATGVTCSR